jgi:hypothetical protein
MIEWGILVWGIISRGIPLEEFPANRAITWKSSRRHHSAGQEPDNPPMHVNDTRKLWHHWCNSQSSKVKFWRTNQNRYALRTFPNLFSKENHAQVCNQQSWREFTQFYSFINHILRQNTIAYNKCGSIYWRITGSTTLNRSAKEDKKLFPHKFSYKRKSLVRKGPTRIFVTVKLTARKIYVSFCSITTERNIAFLPLLDYVQFLISALI